MNNTKRIIVPLTGGLGNQLFQVNAALSLAGHEIILDSRFAKPRIDGELKAEIFNWNLRGKVRIVRGQDVPIFIQKVVGYILRSSMKPKSYESNKAWQLLTKFGGECILGLYLRKRVSIVSSNNVGYFDLEKEAYHSTIFLIGYFQSYRYNENLVQTIADLPIGSFPSLSNLQQRANLEDPICIHVRLGDYLLAPEFGIPHITYFAEALKELSSEYSDQNYWIFSDDIELASERLSKLGLKNVSWFSAVDNSDSATLKAMSLCRRFVLSNSTFSWWAAMLSTENKKVVIVPKPWFKSMEEPKLLIPPSWRRVEAGYNIALHSPIFKDKSD